MRILLFANTEWYLYNFRRSLAQALREAGHEVLLVSPPGHYGEKLQALGFRWVPAPMARRSLNALAEVRLIVWLWWFLRAEQIDLAHGFTIKCAVYCSLAARLAGSRPWVGAVAGLGYVFSSQELQARLLRPLVRAVMRVSLGHPSGRVILQNPDDMALFVKEGLVPPAQLRLIASSGVNCTRFCPAEKPKTDLRVLLPARLLWDKGVGEFVEAARQLKRVGRLDGPMPIRLLLAGEPDPGNPAAVPAEQIREWEAEGLLQWLGHVESMPECLQSVDAVALPTAYGEGVPKALIEAAACGLPLITTDAPGCREVVTHEQEGLLIPVRDATALADAILRLADNPELCERFGKAARDKVVSLFDEGRVIERTMAVYAELE